MFGPRGQPLDWIQAARSAQLGEITDVADWYEQARITVDAGDAGIRVIRVSGDLAAGTAAYLNVVLEREIGTRPPGLVLDLSGGSFIGVRGIATLLRAADCARRQALCLRVVLGEHPEVIRILQRTGAARMLEVGGPLEAGRGRRPPLDATGLGSVPEPASPRHGRYRTGRAALAWGRRSRSPWSGTPTTP